MTTDAAARAYEAKHVATYSGRPLAVFNPHGKPIVELPVIYGFNAGGEPGWYSAQLVAEDGTGLGGHVCSSEGYMPAELGVIEGTRPDRHEHFKAHYPDGYRMDFVSYADVATHELLAIAFARNKVLHQSQEAAAGQ